MWGSVFFINLFSFGTLYDKKSLNLRGVLLKCLPLWPSTANIWEASLLGLLGLKYTNLLNLIADSHILYLYSTISWSVTRLSHSSTGQHQPLVMIGYHGFTFIYRPASKTCHSKDIWSPIIVHKTTYLKIIYNHLLIVSKSYFYR